MERTQNFLSYGTIITKMEISARGIFLLIIDGDDIFNNKITFIVSVVFQPNGKESNIKVKAFGSDVLRIIYFLFESLLLQRYCIKHSFVKDL